MGDSLLPQVYQLMKYKYYDTPEGEDCFKKMLYTTKYASLMGGIIATYDIILFKHIHDVLPMISRATYWIGPFALMGITFSAIPCALQEFRKKDDYWNNAIGGFVTGMVMGGMRQNNAVGSLYGIGLSVFAVFWHVSSVHKWRHEEKKYENQFGQMKREFGTFDHWKRDWTFTKDPRDKKQNN